MSEASSPGLRHYIGFFAGCFAFVVWVAGEIFANSGSGSNLIDILAVAVLFFGGIVVYLTGLDEAFKYISAWILVPALVILWAICARRVIIKWLEGY